MKAPSAAREKGTAAPDGRALMPYLRRLWRGELPLNQVFVNDMLIAGTILNVFAFGLSMVLFGAEAPRLLAGIVFCGPIPYNIFVFVGVWRSAERVRSAWSTTVRMIATAWLILMFFI